MASMLRSPILGKLALSTGNNCASVFSSLFLRPWLKQTTSFTWLMLALMVPGKMPVSTICQNWRKALKVWKTYWGIQSSWKEVTIPGDDVPVPYYIYTKGDSSNSFGIKNDRWTRFLAEKNEHHEKIFLNYRLWRARRVVEKPFGFLAHKFWVLLLTTNQRHTEKSWQHVWSFTISLDWVIQPSTKIWCIWRTRTRMSSQWHGGMTKYFWVSKTI